MTVTIEPGHSVEDRAIVLQGAAFDSGRDRQAAHNLSVDIVGVAHVYTPLLPRK